MINLPFARRESVRGLQTTENSVARSLEQALGISFNGNYPLSAPINKHNLFLLFRHHPVEFLRSEAQRRIGKPVGFYMPEYDSFFYEQRSLDSHSLYGKAVPLHENLHGYLARQNPKVFGLSEKNIDK